MLNQQSSLRFSSTDISNLFTFGGRPFLYDTPSQYLYVGEPGKSHKDLIQMDPRTQSVLGRSDVIQGRVDKELNAVGVWWPEYDPYPDNQGMIDCLFELMQKGEVTESGSIGFGLSGETKHISQYMGLRLMSRLTFEHKAVRPDWKIYYSAYIDTFVPKYVEDQEKLTPGMANKSEYTRDALQFLLTDYIPADVQQEPDFSRFWLEQKDKLRAKGFNPDEPLRPTETDPETLTGWQGEGGENVPVDIHGDPILEEEQHESEPEPELPRIDKVELIDTYLEQLNDAQRRNDSDGVNKIKKRLEELTKNSSLRFADLDNQILTVKKLQVGFDSAFVTDPVEIARVLFYYLENYSGGALGSIRVWFSSNETPQNDRYLNELAGAVLRVGGVDIRVPRGFPKSLLLNSSLRFGIIDNGEWYWIDPRGREHRISIPHQMWAEDYCEEHGIVGDDAQDALQQQDWVRAVAGDDAVAISVGSLNATTKASIVEFLAKNGYPRDWELRLDVGSILSPNLYEDTVGGFLDNDSKFGSLLTFGERKEVSSTQVEIPKGAEKPFIDFANSIPKDELYEKHDEGDPNHYGAETEPHVTVLYGLKTSDPSEVERLVKGFGKIELKFGKTSLFKSKPEYEVLKVDVISEDLHRLNKLLNDNFDVETDHPIYHPHLTIAYVKPGEGEKYVGDDRFEGETVTINTLTFSDSDWKHTPISLTETEKKVSSLRFATDWHGRVLDVTRLNEGNSRDFITDPGEIARTLYYYIEDYSPSAWTELQVFYTEDGGLENNWFLSYLKNATLRVAGVDIHVDLPREKQSSLRFAQMHFGPVELDANQYNEWLNLVAQDKEGTSLDGISPAGVAALQSSLPNFTDIKEQADIGRWHTVLERIKQTDEGNVFLNTLQHHDSVTEPLRGMNPTPRQEHLKGVPDYTAYGYLASGKLTDQDHNALTHNPNLTDETLALLYPKVTTNTARQRIEQHQGKGAQTDALASSYKKKLEDERQQEILRKQLPADIPPELLQMSQSDRQKLARSNDVTVPLQLGLARDKNADVRQTLATNYNIDPQTILLLSGDADPQVRQKVASNPKTPPEILQLLAKDKVARVRRGVTFHPTAPGDLAAMLAGDKEVDVREGVALSRATFPEAVALLHKDNEPYIRKLVANRLDISPEIAATLAQDRDKMVRNAIANNVSTPSHVLALLAGDQSAGVREAVAYNSKTSPEVLALMAGDSDNAVVAAVARNSNATPLVFDAIITNQMDKPNSEALRLAAANTKADEATLDKLSHAKDKGVRERVAKNPNTGESTLVFLVHDPETDIATEALENPKVPLAILAESAESNEPEILISVAKNPRTTAEILSRVLHGDPGVALTSDVLAAIADNVHATPTDLQSIYEFIEDKEGVRNVTQNLAKNPNTPLGILQELANNRDDSTRSTATTQLIARTDAPLLTKDEMKTKGFGGGQAFDHKVVPTSRKVPGYTLSQPGQTWTRYIYAGDTKNEFPVEMFQKFNLHHVPSGGTNNKPLGWVGGTWDPNNKDGKILFVTEMQSDLLQRTFEMNDQRLIQFKPYKSRVENRFDGWPYVFFNQAVREAKAKGADYLAVPSASEYAKHVGGAKNIAAVYEKILSNYPEAIHKADGWNYIPVTQNIKMARIEPFFIHSLLVFGNDE